MSEVNISMLESNLGEKKAASIQFMSDILSANEFELTDKQLKIFFSYFKGKIGKDFLKHVGLKNMIRYYFGKLFTC